MADPSLSPRTGRPRETCGAHDAPQPISLAGGAASGGTLGGEFSRFALVGAGNVGVDLGVYSALLALGAAIPFAKATAFVCGTIFAYWANRLFTFRAKSGDARQFMSVFFLYVVSMAINVGVNSLVIALLGTALPAKALAYCAALAPSALLNFFGMRVIFGRAKAQAEGVETYR